MANGVRTSTLTSSQLSRFNNSSVTALPTNPVAPNTIAILNKE